MKYKGTFYYAAVVQDDLIYEGAVVSPSEFANKITKSSRNAWRDLEIKRPGDGVWVAANIEWRDFNAFEEALRRPGPWIAGIDFPFGQSRKFIENIGWPNTWQGYVEHASSLGRKGFRSILDGYRANRPAGDKEHRRATDVKA